MKKKGIETEKRLTVTGAQLEMLKYRVAGLSLTEIARKLGTTSGAVARSLSLLDNVYDDLRLFVREIEDGELIAKMRQQKLEQTKFTDPAFLRAMKEGVIRQYKCGIPPRGYDVNLNQTEEAPMINQLFEDFDEIPDMSLGALARKYGMTRSQVTYALRNPVYKGYRRIRGIIVKSDHEPIVSEDRWDRVQNKVVDRRFAQRSLPDPYKYRDGHSIFDAKEAPRFKEMFWLRVKGLSFSEIGRQLGMRPHAVRDRIKNPYYANKKLVKGKWVDDDHEAIIDFETWKAANAPSSKERWEKGVELQRQIKAENRNKILACLGTAEKWVSEIAKETGVSRPAVYRHLVLCEKEGLTEKNPPGRRKGKWRFKR